ncbi:Importin subunit alpha [Entamoeba marina]
MSSLVSKHSFQHETSSRTQFSKSLRESNREERMNLRRFKLDTTQPINLPNLPGCDTIKMQCAQIIQGNYSLIPTLNLYLSGDIQPFHIIKESGVIESILPLLNGNDIEHIKNVLWLCNNYISEEQLFTQHLIDCGFFNYVDRIFGIDNMIIVNAILSILANISNFGNDLKQLVINLNIPSITYTLLYKYPSIQTKRTLSWLYSNICNGSIFPLDVITPYAQFLYNTLSDNEDVEVVSDALWGFCYLSENKIYLQLLSSDDVLQKIYMFINNIDLKLALPSLRFFNNVIALDEQLLSKTVSFGILSVLNEIQTSAFLSETKLCWYCRILSNIASSNSDDVLMLLYQQKFITFAISKINSINLQKSIRDELSWVIANYVYGIKPNAIQSLLQSNPTILHSLVQILRDNKTNKQLQSLISVTLKGILNLLKFAVNNDLPLCNDLDVLGLEDICEEIYETSSNKLAKKRCRIIIDTYFVFEEDEDF